MKKLKYILGSIVVGFGLSGCLGQPSLPSVSEEEAFKYEKQYLAEWENWKQQNKNTKPSFKWIQPKNKKDECKVYVGINYDDDKTIKSGYSLFWDGECKDGFAYGLGREIENTMLENLQQIGFYENGKAVDYCIGFDPINNFEENGECSYDFNRPDHYVKTLINEKNGDLQISYEFGIQGSLNNPQMIMRTYPFYDVVEYFKIYPNFSYVIADLTKNEFDNRKYEFNIREHENGKYNGYGFAIMKQGFTNSGEMINGTLVRRVQLPQSYFDKANLILNEIKNEANIALEAQRKALVIKEKYKNKICKDDVKVDFMDNDEYKSICKEEAKIANLKVKIDKKLAEINTIKNQKRDQKRKDEIANAEQRRIQQNIDAQNTMQNIQMLNQTIQLYKAFR